MSIFTRNFTLRVLTALVLSSSTFAGEFTEERTALGKTNGISYDLSPVTNPTDTPASDVKAGFTAALKAILFGKDRSVLEAQGSVTNLLEGETDFYWGGFRVWSTKPQFKDGSFVVSAGLPTVSMRAPIAGVPVGPVTLRVDAGVNAEAEIDLKLTPLLSIPIQFTSVRGELGPKVSASGFVEGYAKWLIIRAGVGAELELVRANAKIMGQVGFGGMPPVISYDGFINLVAGKIYAFADYFNVLVWKWTRAFEPIITDWKGKCIDLVPGGTPPGGVACP